MRLIFRTARLYTRGTNLASAMSFLGLFPPVQFQRRACRKISMVFGLVFSTRTYNVVSMINHLARFGFLSALQIGIAQKIHGVRLVVRLRRVHFRGACGESNAIAAYRRAAAKPCSASPGLSVA
jgi:hypothetical protein